MTRLLRAWRAIAPVALALVVSVAGHAQSPAPPPKITMDSVLRALHAGDSAIAFATR